MQAERAKIYAIAAKIHAVIGTDPVPTFAANALRVIGQPELTINYLEEGDRADEQHAGMGAAGQGEKVGRWGQIDVSLAIKGGGADYSAGANKPEWDALLRAAGFSATVSGVGGAGVIMYTTLDSGAFERVALYCQSANKLYKLIDCIALPKLNAEAAKRGVFTFTVIGRMSTDPAESAFAGQTLSSVAAPAFHSQAISIGAYATPTVRKLDLDFGTAHTPLPSAGATDGLDGFEITDRDLKLGMEIQVVPLATFDPYVLGKQAWPGGTDTKVDFQVGAAQFNRVKFALGQWAFGTPPNSDNSGIATWNLQGRILARSLASGREITITAD
ncbi:MAG: hypothetical protein WEA80_01865 [Gemmatimonadaceae bacterium]